MTEAPFVSICLPNYNKGEYISETIQSILDQTYKNFELIIVDNASTDNSMEVINSFSDKRMEVYRNDTNIGSVENVNKCIEYAKGDYFALFHSDDLYPRRIVELEAKGLSSFEYVGIASANQTGDLSEFRKRKDDNVKCEIFEQSGFLKYLFSGRTLNCASVMIKRVCCEQIGTYDPNLFEGVDQDLYLKIASKYGLALITDLEMYKRPWPREMPMEYMELWIHAYGVLKETARKVYEASTYDAELERLYTYFIATQDRNIYRRSLLMKNYKRARKHLLLYFRNMVKYTSDDKLSLWQNRIDNLVNAL
jgi:glycosyltransferase involved in cell wall biosynthesis